MSKLKAIDLCVGYASNKVLIEAINTEITSGQLIGLIGQNGVGKSTLIKTLLGFHPPISGEVSLNNKPIGSLSAKELAKQVSVVLTGKPESLNLSVTELIALGRYPYSGWLGTLKAEDKESVESALTMMEINYIAHKKLYELSDGQMQKVMIARAIAQETNLIVLDEPTSHLDLKNKIEVLSLLKKIANAGKGVLMSTHEIQLTSQVCTEYWCIDFNQPVLVGKPKELINEGYVHNYLHLPSEITIN